MASEAIMNEGLAEGQQELDHEAGLIRRAKARSPEAWTEIYESSHPKLFRYVMARVGDQDIAEDLTATVFMEALKSIDTYSSRGRPLLAWLYRIARNVVSYHHRTVFRKKASQELLAAPARVLSQFLGARRRQDQPAAEAPSVNEASELANPASLVERWDLRQAIGHLSIEQREVIILRYYVGLTTPEVARLVGKHERAVYSLQTRAIKALRRRLH
jgi:RNA polymerase sigma-70 factor (ECF subfamily)